MAGLVGYRPEIDGLRAFAVIPVILFHMGLNLVPGGYIGVDVFFVISGFLITSIIKKELELGTFSFRDFWARRIRRILPAMVCVTAVTLAATFAFVFRPEQQAIGKQALASLLSVANIYFWRSAGDYWGNAAEESPFLHAWSLSVEEQFYLFFPITIWLVFRFRLRWLQGCILAAVVASLVLFLWGSQNSPVATFYLLPTRVWELGTGCLLAVTLHTIRSGAAEGTTDGVFAVGGLCMVLASYLFIDKPSGGSALPVVGTGLIIAFGQTGICNKLLSHRAVVHTGKISYSLYLWHWPVLVFAKHLGLEWPGVSDTVILGVAIYVLSLATYHFVERPTRRRNGIVPLILLSGILVAFAALGMAWTPRFYDTSQFDEGKYISYNVTPNKSINAAKSGTIVIEWPGYKPDAYYKGGIRVGDESVSPAIVVLGDSHAVMWSDAVALIAQEEEISTAFYCMSGVSPFVEIPPTGKGAAFRITKGQKLQFDEARLRDLEKWKPKLVIIAMAWKEPQDEDAFAFLEFLGRLGSQVLLIEDPPLPSYGERNLMQWLAAQGILPVDGKRQFVPYKALNANEGGRQVVRDLAAKYDHVQFLPTYDLFVSKAGALVLDGKSVLYFDNDHLLQAGAHKIVPRLREKILEIIPGRW